MNVLVNTFNLYSHGSRMNRKQDFLEVVVIIAATPATSGYRELIIHALQGIQNDMAYHRKVFRCIILAHARVILAEHTGTVLCVEGLWHGGFGFPIALGRVAVV